MYEVTEDDAVKEQIAALPAEAAAVYAELRVVLETAPWSGRPYTEVLSVTSPNNGTPVSQYVYCLVSLGGH